MHVVAWLRLLEKWILLKIFKFAFWNSFWHLFLTRVSEKDKQIVFLYIIEISPSRRRNHRQKLKYFSARWSAPWAVTTLPKPKFLEKENWQTYCRISAMRTRIVHWREDQNCPLMNSIGCWRTLSPLRLNNQVGQAESLLGPPDPTRSSDHDRRQASFVTHLNTTDMEDLMSIDESLLNSKNYCS